MNQEAQKSSEEISLHSYNIKRTTVKLEKLNLDKLQFKMSTNTMQTRSRGSKVEETSTDITVLKSSVKGAKSATTRSRSTRSRSSSRKRTLTDSVPKGPKLYTKKDTVIKQTRKRAKTQTDSASSLTSSSTESVKLESQEVDKNTVLSSEDEVLTLTTTELLSENLTNQNEIKQINTSQKRKVIKYESGYLKYSFWQLFRILFISVVLIFTLAFLNNYKGDFANDLERNFNAINDKYSTNSFFHFFSDLVERFKPKIF